jgi:hypothetical protein
MELLLNLWCQPQKSPFMAVVAAVHVSQTSLLLLLKRRRHCPRLVVWSGPARKGEFVAMQCCTNVGAAATGAVRTARLVMEN